MVPVYCFRHVSVTPDRRAPDRRAVCSRALASNKRLNHKRSVLRPLLPRSQPRSPADYTSLLHGKSIRVFLFAPSHGSVRGY